METSSPSTIAARLFEVYEYYKNKREESRRKSDKFKTYGKSDFAAEWGTNPASLSYYFSGQQVPNGQAFEKFAQAFDEINLDWMFSGKGQMLKGEQEYASHMGVSSTSEPKGEYHVEMKFMHKMVSAADYWEGFHKAMAEVRELRSQISYNLQNDIG